MGNRFIYDLRRNTKRSLNSAKDRMAKISLQWADEDNYIASMFDEVINQLEEIESEITQTVKKDG